MAAVHVLDLAADLPPGEAGEQIQPERESEEEEQLLHAVLQVRVAPVLPPFGEGDLNEGGVAFGDG